MSAEQPIEYKEEGAGRQRKGRRRSPNDDLGDAAAEQAISEALFDRPGFLARRYQQICVSIFLDELAELDITPLQFGVLAIVRRQPGIDQKRVAEGLGLDRTTVMGIVDRLERKELVVRRISPENRRNRMLYLTAEGQDRLIEAASEVSRAEPRMLEPLSEKDRSSFLKLLRRVVDHHNHSVRVPVGGFPKRDAGG